MGVEIEGATSPDVPDQDAAEHIAAPEGAEIVEAPADSSDADPKGEPFDMLSVVRDAATKAPAKDAASPAAESEDPTEPKDAPKAEASDPKKGAAEAEGEHADVPFHKHPRFQKLVRERDELRKPAEDYGKLQQWLQREGLDGKEAFTGMSMVALAKRDPAAAWEQMKPFIQDLAIRAGAVLPQDLAQKVKTGELPRDAAFELSRNRALVASAETRRREETAVREREEAERSAYALRSEAARWESEARAKDVDFTAKGEELVREITYLQRIEGVPETPEGVRRQLDTAYQAVTRRMTSALPPKREVRPVGGGGVAGTPRAAPKDMMDIVRRHSGVA